MSCRVTSGRGEEEEDGEWGDEDNEGLASPDDSEGGEEGDGGGVLGPDGVGRCDVVRVLVGVGGSGWRLVGKDTVGVTEGTGGIGCRDWTELQPPLARSK